MKKISSTTTHFRKKYFPIILLIFLFGIIYLNAIYTIKTKWLIFFISAIILFGYVWISSYRKLKTVYLENDFLRVDDKIILLNNIKSIKKEGFFCYKVKYSENNKLNEFTFMVDSIPFITPHSIKEINFLLKK